MIHELIKLERPLIIFDVETTGLDPTYARIIELGFQLFTADGLQKEWRSLIDPGVPIPPETTAVHHITDDDIRSCQTCHRVEGDHPTSERSAENAACDQFDPVLPFAQLAVNIARGFSNCDLGGKNVRFDIRFLAAEMKRAGVEWSYVSAKILDAERLEQIAEPRNLSGLYKKYTGKELEDAHQALADVQATTEVLIHQLTRHTQLPRSLHELHELQWPGWLDAEGKFAWDGDDVIINFGGPKGHKGKRLADTPRSYLEWMLRSEFADDTKLIIRNALLGVYPSKRP